MSQSSQLRKYKAEEFECITDEAGELGAGGFGVVRYAVHGVLGPVALKCSRVTGGLQQKENIADDINTELELLQKSNHAHVLRVYGWTEWSGSMALVMEYMPGGNLINLLKNKRSKLSTILRLRACVEVSDAISFIHNLTPGKRLVHGDIKPQNVLVSDELHFKLGDFGGAKLSNYTGQAVGFRVGEFETQTLTPVYAAPERLALVPVEPRRDQDTYSFGLIIYSVLTGEEPFARYGSFQSYLQAIFKGLRPSTKPINDLKRSLTTSREKEIISTLESLMKRCWDHKPSRRPNMPDVRDQLQQLLRQTKPVDVLINVTDTLKRINISVPSMSDHPCALLYHFDTVSNRFPEGCQRQRQRVRHQKRQPARQEQTQQKQRRVVQQNQEKVKRPLQGSLRPSGCQQQKQPVRHQKRHSARQGQIRQKQRRVVQRNQEKVKLPLQDIFRPSDPSQLPGNVRQAPNFLARYKVSLKNQKYEEAKTMTAKITSMIEDNIDATAKDVREFGKKLREKKLFLESIAIFDAASDMFEKMGKTGESLKRMTICVEEIMDTNKAMIGNDVSMKKIVKSYVIPLMREKLHHIEDTSSVSEQFKCLQVCWVLHCIEFSEGLVDEWKEREKTVCSALTRMMNVFKADVMSYYIYGILLSNIGHVCENLSRFREAASFCKQAIDVYKAATDFCDEERKKRDIETNKHFLKTVQQKMK